MDAAAIRLRREHNDRVTLAWNTAALGRQKKLPKLERLLTKEQPAGKPRQPWELQYALIKGWARQHNRMFGKNDRGQRRDP